MLGVCFLLQDYSGNGFNGTLPNKGTLSGTTLLLSTSSNQYVTLPIGFRRKLGKASSFTGESTLLEELIPMID